MGRISEDKLARVKIYGVKNPHGKKICYGGLKTQKNRTDWMDNFQWLIRE